MYFASLISLQLWTLHPAWGKFIATINPHNKHLKSLLNCSVMYETCDIIAGLLAFCKCFMAFHVIWSALTRRWSWPLVFFHTNLSLIPDPRPIAPFLFKQYHTQTHVFCLFVHRIYSYTCTFDRSRGLRLCCVQTCGALAIVKNRTRRWQV